MVGLWSLDVLRLIVQLVEIREVVKKLLRSFYLSN